VRRLIAIAVGLALVVGVVVFLRSDGQTRTYKASFSRAVQLFPGGKVRVLGVDVGEITDTRNVRGGVEVTFRIDDPDVLLPEDVEAAIVPMSLLGERYVQLFPSYGGGAALPEGDTIPMERTAVPSEPDELLRSLQDYLGALDPATVSAFVDNAATVLEGNGQELNELIDHASSVIGTLSAKRGDLAQIVVQFDKLSRALNTRQEGLANLIHSYNAVARTLTTNRVAVEGTITGLSDAATELASLLLAHRRPLHQDIKTLTRTGRTIGRNIDTFTETGFWAQRLFRAASNAVDYNKDWLRLNNQGEELSGLIIMRLEERLLELCEDLDLPTCSFPRYWERSVPSLFCFDARCPPPPAPHLEEPQEQLTEAIGGIPALAERMLQQARRITCADAEDKKRCLERKRALIKCADASHPGRCLERETAQILCQGADDLRACLREQKGKELKELVEGLLDESLGDPLDLGGVVP
jgi:phospholipid/cholesterol/gamma-HCH transport system substrate-binding protein